VDGVHANASWRLPPWDDQPRTPPAHCRELRGSASRAWRCWSRSCFVGHCQEGDSRGSSLIRFGSERHQPRYRNRWLPLPETRNSYQRLLMAPGSVWLLRAVDLRYAMTRTCDRTGPLKFASPTATASRFSSLWRLRCRPGRSRPASGSIGFAGSWGSRPYLTDQGGPLSVDADLGPDLMLVVFSFPFCPLHYQDDD
jgi:hypothetical protein